MANELNPHRNIEFIKSQSPTGLRNKLRFISTPYGINTIYFDGKDHVAWITPDRPFSNKLRQMLDRVEQKTNERLGNVESN